MTFVRALGVNSRSIGTLPPFRITNRASPYIKIFEREKNTKRNKTRKGRGSRGNLENCECVSVCAGGRKKCLGQWQPVIREIHAQNIEILTGRIDTYIYISITVWYPVTYSHCPRSTWFLFSSNKLVENWTVSNLCKGLTYVRLDLHTPPFLYLSLFLPLHSSIKKKIYVRLFNYWYILQSCL